jgi:two-component system response regulator DevR
LAPVVVLLDVRLPDGSGIRVCEEILRKRPATHVLMLSSLADDRVVREAIEAGARGYLLKGNDGPALLSAITRAAAGQSIIDPALAGGLPRIVRRGTESPVGQCVDALSAQERRALALLAQGLTNKEIGDRLGLTEKTVKNYGATIFTKLQVTRRAQAAAFFCAGGECRFPGRTPVSAAGLSNRGYLLSDFLHEHQRRSAGSRESKDPGVRLWLETTRAD